jgi:endonuclease/exonuclease/phosphatase family metal-dependent hydrolase
VKHGGVHLLRHAVAVAVCALLLALPDGAEGGSTTFRTFQHNVEQKHWGSIKYIVEHDPPLIVTAQELCADSVLSVRHLLEAHGYRVATHTAAKGSTPCGGKDGLISLVASRGTMLKAIDQNYPAQSDPRVTRGFVCMKSQAYLLSWWACSTHITAHGADTATSQIAYLRGVAMVLNDRPVIVSGDFNRTPGQSGPVKWRESFVEVDQRYNRATYDNDPGDPLTKKLDYTFSMRLRTDAPTGSARVGCGPTRATSDHCFVHGKLRFLY